METDDFLTVRVSRRWSEAIDICSFELVDVAGGHLPQFSAGSHIDVHLPGGVIRQYSLCNDSAETHRYLICVLKDAASRGGSQAMHEQVQEGGSLRISAPKNHFALSSGAHRSLLLAGGIGITPILCMAERLATGESDFELHYCTRSRERAAFTDRIASSKFESRVHFHFDDQAEAQKINLPLLLAGAGEGTHLYVCGPRGFMDAVLSTARAQGWPEARLHFEFFGAKVAPLQGDGSFDVQLASSGRIVSVPKHLSVVDALQEAGVAIPTSCGQGVCGTCLTRVLDGIPDHRDSYLTADEQARNDEFTPCCSRSKSPMLVLDL